MKKFLSWILIVAAAVTVAMMPVCSAEDYISREEFCNLAAALYQELGSPGTPKDTAFFKDTENENVLLLSNLGIISGTGNQEFSPDDNLTRQEMLVILTKLIDVCFEGADTTMHPEYAFDDDSFIAYWAQDAADYLYWHGVVKGTEEYTISPLAHVTREQAKTFLNRVRNGSFDFAKETAYEFHWAIEPDFDGLVPDTKFSGGLAAVSKNGRYGYINKAGETVIGFHYDMADPFSDGLAKVEIDGKIGYVNKNGDIVIPIEYEDGGEYREGRVWAKKDGKYGFFDGNGSLVIPFQYDNAYNFSEGCASVKKGDKYGYLNYDGSVFLPFIYQWAGEFHEDRARIYNEDAYDYIDKTGGIFIDGNYTIARDFSEGRAVVWRYMKCAVIDVYGNTYIPFGKFDRPDEYSGGYLRIEKKTVYEGRRSFVDMNGKEIVNVNYSNFSDAGQFHEGLAWVAHYSRTWDKILRSYMDKDGNCILPYRTDITERSISDLDCFYLQHFSEGMAAVVDNNGKLGFIKNPYFSQENL